MHLASVVDFDIIIKVERGCFAVPLSEKKKASNAKWDAENLKRMSLAVPCSLHIKMQEHINQTGESMNGFIKRAIDETISNDEQKRKQE